MWHFLDLSQDQKLERRRLLDLYGSLAQVSALIPLAILQIYFFIGWLQRRWARRNGGDDIPSSPQLKKQRSDGLTGSVARSKETWRKVSWWMGDSIDIWGSRVTEGEIVAGVVWTAWLLFLSCVQTQGGMFSSTRSERQSLSRNRLPPPYETIWYRRCIATATTISSCLQVAVQSCPPPHRMLLANSQCSTPSPGSHLDASILSARRVLSELFYPSTRPSKTHQGLGCYSRTSRNHRFHSCRNNCTLVGSQVELSSVLHHSRHSGQHIASRALFPCPPYSHLHFGDAGSICSASGTAYTQRTQSGGVLDHGIWYFQPHGNQHPHFCKVEDKVHHALATGSTRLCLIGKRTGIHAFAQIKKSIHHCISTI